METVRFRIVYLSREIQVERNTQSFLKAEFTAPFNNTRTLKFKAQSTNAFFATVNQMFGGSSQLPTMLTELGSTM